MKSKREYIRQQRNNSEHFKPKKGEKYDINTGLPTKDPHGVTYKEVYVNRITGEPTSKSKDPTAIKGNSFWKSTRFVNGVTGKTCSADDEEAVTYNKFRNHIPMNSKTGMRTTKDDPDAIPSGSYWGKIPRNSKTGERTSVGDPDAVPSSLYCAKQRALKLGDDSADPKVHKNREIATTTASKRKAGESLEHPMKKRARYDKDSSEKQSDYLTSSKQEHNISKDHVTPTSGAFYLPNYLVQSVMPEQSLEQQKYLSLPEQVSPLEQKHYLQDQAGNANHSNSFHYPLDVNPQNSLFTPTELKKDLSTESSYSEDWEEYSSMSQESNPIDFDIDSIFSMEDKLPPLEGSESEVKQEQFDVMSEDSSHMEQTNDSLDETSLIDEDKPIIFPEVKKEQFDFMSVDHPSFEQNNSSTDLTSGNYYSFWNRELSFSNKTGTFDPNDQQKKSNKTDEQKSDLAGSYGIFS